MDDWMKGMTDFQRDSVARLASRQKSCQMRFNSLCRDEREWKEEHKKLLAERDALKQRVAELEAKPADRELRERLVCAALTGLLAQPTLASPQSWADIAVRQADAVLARLRKEGGGA